MCLNCLQNPATISGEKQFQCTATSQNRDSTLRVDCLDLHRLEVESKQVAGIEATVRGSILDSAKGRRHFDEDNVAGIGLPLFRRCGLWTGHGRGSRD